MNTATIAASLASTFGDLTPPDGYAGITLATHRLPNAVTQYPTLLVKPPTRPLRYMGGIAWGPFTFPVELYVASIAPEDKAADAVYAWWDVVTLGLQASYDLDQSDAGVVDATVVGMRAGVLTYAGQDHVGLLLEVEVNAQNAFNPTT